ncbi:MAG: 50S ribosomal protein L11 methyltransferase [Lachnospiraceae bacterium]|nr:50S ribosomal protein L11 methyltransferase [Lachnospiraceae bacterium]
MKWIRFRIRTVPEAEDILISELSELGLTGAQIEDHVPLTAAEKEQIYTYDADDPEDDGIAHVSFYAAVCEDGRLSLSGDPEADARERKDARELEEEIRDTLASVRSYMDIGDGTLSVSITDDAEWKDKWKQFFHSFQVDDVFITPSWEAEDHFGTENRGEDKQGASAPEASAGAENRPRYTLRIDPGTAFGTGAHETTQLAIRAIRTEIEGRLREAADIEASCTGAQAAPLKILDVGTGSGILSILALMFGADFAVGTDLDVFTKDATAQNLRENGIDPARFSLVIGNLIDDQETQEEVLRLSAACISAKAGKSDPAAANAEECPGEDPTDAADTKRGYDIVVANILPVVLKPLTPVIPRFLKPGGVYITSGILAEKEEEMRQVLAASGFFVETVTVQGEWCCMVSYPDLHHAGRG